MARTFPPSIAMAQPRPPGMKLKIAAVFPPGLLRQNAIASFRASGLTSVTEMLPSGGGVRIHNALSPRPMIAAWARSAMNVDLFRGEHHDMVEDVDWEFADDFESAEIRHRGAPLLRRLQQNLASAVDEKDGERAMHQSKLMLAQLLIRANLGIAFVD
jgi:hypothetical protein